MTNVFGIFHNFPSEKSSGHDVLKKKGHSYSFNLPVAEWMTRRAICAIIPFVGRAGRQALSGIVKIVATIATLALRVTPSVASSTRCVASSAKIICGV
jgi:hypothetical protein